MNTTVPPILNNFGAALRTARALTEVTQEAFDGISSRTYVSSLERGLKSPTLQKVDSLASVLGIHPLILLTLAYCEEPLEGHVEQLVHELEEDISRLFGGKLKLRNR